MVFYTRYITCHLNIAMSDYCLTPICHFFSAILWRDQVTLWCLDDDVRFVLDQHVHFDLYTASSVKQSTGRHVAPLRHIILIPSQPVFAFIPWCYVLCGEATNTSLIVYQFANY
jgi:hypothetical protein